LVKTFGVGADSFILVHDDRHVLVHYRSIQLLDLATGKALWETQIEYPHDIGYTALFALPGEKTAISLRAFGETVGATLFNLDTGEAIANWSTQFHNTVFGISGGLSPDGRHFAAAVFSGSVDYTPRTVRLWVVATETMKVETEWPLFRWKGLGNRLTWLDNERFIGANGELLVTFDFRHPNEQPEVGPEPFTGYVFAVSPDRRMLVNDQGNRLTLAEIAQPENKTILPSTTNHRRFEFVGQSLLAALEMAGHAVSLWDLNGQRLIGGVNSEEFMDGMAIGRDASFALVRAPNYRGKNPKLALWRLRDLGPPVASARVTRPQGHRSPPAKRRRPGGRT
jgi:hypothetical protein